MERKGVILLLAGQMSNKSPKCRVSGKFGGRMPLRPKTGERLWEPACSRVAVEKATFVEPRQGPFYHLAVKPTGWPHILSQEVKGMAGTPPPPRCQAY